MGQCTSKKHRSKAKKFKEDDGDDDNDYESGSEGGEEEEDDDSFEDASEDEEEDPEIMTVKVRFVVARHARVDRSIVHFEKVLRVHCFHFVIVLSPTDYLSLFYKFD